MHITTLLHPAGGHEKAVCQEFCILDYDSFILTNTARAKLGTLHSPPQNNNLLSLVLICAQQQRPSSQPRPLKPTCSRQLRQMSSMSVQSRQMKTEQIKYIPLTQLKRYWCVFSHTATGVWLRPFSAAMWDLKIRSKKSFPSILLW